MLLLNAHFEAYLEDVLQEALTFLNSGLSANTIRRDFTTPRPHNIDRLFVLLGIDKISMTPSWQKASNKSVRKAIDELEDARNAVAHGEKDAKATKADLTRYRKYVQGFSAVVDDLVADRVKTMSGRKPW